MSCHAFAWSIVLSSVVAASSASAQDSRTFTLPAPSYPSLPGWLVIEGRGLAGHAGIAIFPQDSMWRRVSTRAALTLVTAGSAIPVHTSGAAAPDETWNATVVGVRAVHGAALPDLPVGWLLPAAAAAQSAGIPLRESLSRDQMVRTWIAGPARLRLRKTGRRSAEFWAERAGVQAILIGDIGVNPKADAEMGVDSDTVLTFQNWRMPVAIGAFRLGINGPVVVIYTVHGYECQNWRLVIFHAKSIEHIAKPHYLECAV